MGIFSGLLGHASEANTEKVEQQLENFLIENESIVKAYKLVRDLMVLTDKRCLLIDRQGLTGAKTEFVSVPYRSIIKFSMETAGHLDMEAELTLWLTGNLDPIKLEITRNNDALEACRILARFVCA